MAAMFVILVAVGLVLLLNSLFPGTLQREGAQMGVVYSIALVALLSSTIAFTFRQRWSKTVKHALIWVLLMAVLVLLYSYRGDFEHAYARIASELVPGMAIERAPGEVFLRASEGGHFRARAEIDGMTVVLMVDTGASAVVLTQQDAERAGIEPRSLAYSTPVNTANGITYVAPIRIDKMAIGPIRLSDVTGAVAQPGNLDESLLGMSFLGRLEAVEFGRDGLVLRQ